MEPLVYDIHSYRTFVCGHCGYEITIPLSCGDRFCDICGKKRRYLARLKLRSVVEQLEPAPGMCIRHLTLTIPHSTDVSDGAKTLIRSFRKLRQRTFWKNRVSGGCFVIEVTGKPDAYHVHLHVIVYSRWIPHKDLSRHWSKVSPGHIVWVSRVPQGAAVNYLTKYITKESVAEPFRKTVSNALRGFRLFQFFGAWHGIANSIKIPRLGCPECGASKWLLDTEFDKQAGALYRLTPGRSPPFLSPLAPIKRDLKFRYGWNESQTVAFLANGQLSPVKRPSY